MRLFVGILMFLMASEAQAQLDASQIKPSNLPIVWQCKGKYSGRELNIRAQLGDFNPLIYVESAGLNMFIGDEHSLQKPVWKSQGGLHLCMASEHAGERSLHFLQIVDSFLNPSRTSSKGEYQRFAKYTGAAGCAGLQNAGIFAESEYMECSYAGTNLPVGDYVHGGTLTVEATSFLQVAKIAYPQKVTLRTAGYNSFILATGEDGSRVRWANLGTIQLDTINWLIDEEALSKSIAGIAGLKWETGVGTDFFSIEVSKDGSKIYLLGRLLDRRKDNRLQKHFVVQLTSQGAIIPSYGTKGIAFIGGLKHWSKDLDENKHPSMTSLGDGQLAVMTFDSAANYETPARFVVLKPDGSEDVKFRETLAKNTSLMEDLKHFEVLRLMAGDSRGGALLIVEVNSSTQGRKNHWLKLNAKGELDENFVKAVLASPIAQKCFPDSAVAMDNGGWFLGGDCSRGYFILKVRADGSMDQTFGIDGLAMSTTWQTQMNTEFKLNTLDYTGVKLTVARDGRLIVPFTWKGKISENSQSGHLVVKADGQLDTSFGMRGLVSSGLGKAMARFRQEFLIPRDGHMKSIAVGNDGTNRGLILQRYK